MLTVHSIDILWKKCGTEYFINVLKKETFKTIGNILVLSNMKLFTLAIEN